MHQQLPDQVVHKAFAELPEMMAQKVNKVYEVKLVQQVRKELPDQVAHKVQLV
jgi:hypothetical protein